MFLDPIDSCGPGAVRSPCSEDVGSHGDRLATMVKAAFPALPLDGAVVDRSGGDHVLLIADGRVFRFPREGMHDLALEVDVLRALQRRCAVPTPVYDHVDPAGRFAGYPFLDGVALTPSRFAALPPVQRDQVLRSATLFLAELHDLSPDAIAPAERWPVCWTAARYAERGLAERLPVVARLLPAQADAIEAFYTRYERDFAPRRVVVHGDLVAEHVLLDDRSGMLAGIIDFGDVALGDPAQDLLLFWNYGADAARRALRLYDPGCADPGLQARSRNHFIRYRLDRLFEHGARNGDFDRAQAAAEIDVLLTV